MPPPLLVSIEAGVQRLTLNRPDKLNAFIPETHRLLREALAQAESDPAVRCVLFTGAGRAFCAGQDLSERKAAAGGTPRDLSDSVGEYYNPLVRRLRALPKPVLAAVNGVAAGAGASLALACDLVLAARSASFIQAFARIGLTLDSGGSYFLPRLVGQARAMGLALLGERLAAADAERWGLIWRCVDDAQLMTEADALARALAAGPTRAYGLIKRALGASPENSLDAQLDLEAKLQREAGLSEDYAEGVAAFLEKRAPSFKGR